MISDFSGHLVSRVYIAGPMTGLLKYNRPAFAAAAKELRAAGFEVFSPGELAEGLAWELAMRICLSELVVCKSAVFLPGWEKSRGAIIEHGVVKGLRMPVWYWDLPDEVNWQLAGGRRYFF